jgi:hypothetical protein
MPLYENNDSYFEFCIANELISTVNILYFITEDTSLLTKGFKTVTIRMISFVAM